MQITKKQITKVLIGFPADLLKRIDKLVKERNTDRTKLVCEILENYNPELDENVEAEFRRRIEALEKEVQQLKKLKK